MLSAIGGLRKMFRNFLHRDYGEVPDQQCRSSLDLLHSECSQDYSRYIESPFTTIRIDTTKDRSIHVLVE